MRVDLINYTVIAIAEAIAAFLISFEELTAERHGR